MKVKWIFSGEDCGTHAAHSDWRAEPLSRERERKQRRARCLPQMGVNGREN